MPSRKISKSRKHTKRSSKRSRASKLRSRKSQRGGAYSYLYSSNGINNWLNARDYQVSAIESLLASGQDEYYYNNRGINFNLIKLQKRIDNTEPINIYEINFQFIRDDGTIGYLRRNGMSDEHYARWMDNY